MIIRYCLRLLLSVRELHRLGYECLRIAPGLNASGSAWRCALAPAALMKPRHGALLDRPVDELVAYYSSAEERRYFGEPARFGGSRQLLAGMIVQRFPALVRQSYGAYFGPFRSLISLQAVHPFRSKPFSRFAPCRSPVFVQADHAVAVRVDQGVSR